jgi:DNA-binding CsgD family transcriptional regulator
MSAAAFGAETDAAKFPPWSGKGMQRANELAVYEAFGRPALDGLTRFAGAAWRLERTLAETRADLAARGAALDQIGHGAVIVGADGRVLFANDPARRLAETGGFTLGTETSGLTADNAAEAARLAYLVADAARGGAGGSVRITRPRPLAMLAATVAALPPAPPAHGMALVTLRDLSATADITPAQLMELFDLTAAEAAIVPQLVEGESAHMIAQSRGVAVATVRAQAARVLAKTGAANLRALATMVAALGA